MEIAQAKTHQNTPGGRSFAVARKLKTTEAGQSILEGAITLPLLLLLLLGVAEFGRAVFIYMTVSHAASAGAAYGSQNPTTALDFSGMTAAATSDAVFTGMTATPNHYCGCDQGGGTSCNGSGSSCAGISCAGQITECVQVTTHATFAPLFRYPGLPTSYQANGNAVMRVRK